MVAALDGAADAAAGLSVTSLHISGTVPEQGAAPPQPGQGGPRNIDVSSLSGRPHHPRPRGGGRRAARGADA
jgi:hypothetical protein